MERCLIVAVDDNFGIGINGDMPWHIAEDLKYFKNVTHGFPVIMGRTTWESLPFKPLKGRKNIVLSRNCMELPGAVCVRSFEEAFAEAEPSEKCFIMGGSSVYRAVIDEMDTLYVTHVHTIVEGVDAFFPQIDGQLWEMVSLSETHTDAETGFAFEFAVYKKRA